MKGLHLLTRLAAFATVAVSLLALTVRAGDKIVFSDDKPKAPNPTETKPAADVFRSWNTKLDAPSFDYGLLGIPTIPRANIGSKEQRRHKNEQTEREQWMFLKPGELQKKEEERSVLGVVNKPLDNLDKDDGDKKDYTFDKLREPKKDQRRQPGEIRSSNQTPSQEDQALAAQQQREREDSDAEPKRERTFTLPGTEQPGRSSRDLNLTGLFDPSKRDNLSSADSGKGELSLHDIFAGTAVRSDTIKQKARMDDFNKNVLNSSTPVDLSGGNNLLTSPQNSAAGGGFMRPADSFGSRPASGNLFNSGSSLNSGYPQGYQNPMTSPGLPTMNNNSGLQGSSPFFPQTQGAQSPSRNWSAPPMEFQRRKG